MAENYTPPEMERLKYRKEPKPDNSTYMVDGCKVTKEEFDRILEDSGMLPNSYKEAEYLNKHFPWQTTPDKTARFMKSPTHIFTITEKID